VLRTGTEARARGTGRKIDDGSVSHSPGRLGIGVDHSELVQSLPNPLLLVLLAPSRQDNLQEEAPPC
jgi:hypothetical protein